MDSAIYHSNGKLLLTGEYLVIDGAQALAVPTQLGQQLKVEYNSSNHLHWVSYDCHGKRWLEVTLDLHSLDLIESSDHEKGKWIQQLLKNCRTLNPNFLSSGAKVVSHLQFERNWGLGSSSTIINCVANWAEINPFQLHFSISNGSGYDIACASSDQACIYEVNQQSPKVRYFDYHPTFADSIFFVHLNNKQNSFKQVSRYNIVKQEVDLAQCVEEISSITNKIINSTTLSDFEEGMIEHEFLISNILQQDTIKESLFQMYRGGIIKSLGAWGGDFVMVTGTPQDMEYFRSKGYQTILSYHEMVK